MLAIFAREGWRAERVQQRPARPGFSLVRGWIENHTGIEIADRPMRAEYERFFAQMVSQA